jgi:hypothetical protein
MSVEASQLLSNHSVRNPLKRRGLEMSSSLGWN